MSLMPFPFLNPLTILEGTSTRLKSKRVNVEYSKFPIFVTYLLEDIQEVCTILYVNCNTGVTATKIKDYWS